MFARYLFLRFKDRREIRQINPSQTLMNLQYMVLTLGWSYSRVILKHGFTVKY